jgi:AraC family transcriptional regulator, transcriptional activator of pobA
MKTDHKIKTDDELFEGAGGIRNIKVRHFNKRQISAYFNATIYTKSSLFILVLVGSARFEINFKEYTISADNIMLLPNGHFARLREVSADFESQLLYVRKSYALEVQTPGVIYKYIQYGVKMHGVLIQHLSIQHTQVLGTRLKSLEEIILLSKHRYCKELIALGLQMFLLDLSNIYEDSRSEASPPQLSRDELYFQKFLELLVDYYMHQHQVGFYADRLDITPQYLTLIVKRLSGQTVSDLIFQLLFDEAKKMLRQPGASITRIAEDLNFSDQSSFGKFFKRKSGISPKDFKRRPR